MGLHGYSYGSFRGIGSAREEIVLHCTSEMNHLPVQRSTALMVTQIAENLKIKTLMVVMCNFNYPGVSLENSFCQKEEICCLDLSLINREECTDDFKIVGVLITIVHALLEYLILTSSLVKVESMDFRKAIFSKQKKGIKDNTILSSTSERRKNRTHLKKAIEAEEVANEQLKIKNDAYCRRKDS
ncbi:hypothetical protein E2320_017035 [Naja naja]|nr:hypothetical protein E2320_017035 [Naja naja]